MSLSAITVRDVSVENLPDLELCVPRERRGELAFVAGLHQQRRWALEMLDRWGTFAKIAYRGAAPVGLIQYRPVPEERAVFIYCVFVPERGHWRRGAASRLLASLLADVRAPHPWFGGRPARLLVTRPFPGERAGQLSARDFFLRRGFQVTGGEPETLYYPVGQKIPLSRVRAITDRAAADRFFDEQPPAYVPQEEDRGKAVIIYGPAFCPFAYGFLLRAEARIREIAPDLPVRWISTVAEPEEVKRRGSRAGCIVNGRLIRAFVLDGDRFQREVREALGLPPPG